MAQVTVQWNGNPPCGATSPPYVGEEYILYLDQSRFTSDVTSGVVGTFVSEGPGGPSYERTYTFDIADSAVPDGVEGLSSCDIKAVACQDSCCAELTRQIADIEFGNVNAVAGEHVFAQNEIRIDLNNGNSFTFGLEPNTISAGTATDNTTGGSGLHALGERLHFFSNGGLDIDVLGGIGDVQIEPANITVDLAVTGIVTPPADPTRPALHYAENGLHVWDPVSGAWVKSTSGRIVSVFPDDPPLLGDGSGHQVNHTVAGAQLGDRVQVSFLADTQGVMLYAWVSAADTVTVRFQNETGGSVDLPAANVKVVLLKD